MTKGKVALVNAVSWVRLNRKGWKAKLSRGGWYAYKAIKTQGKTHYVYMHREIANCPKGKITHHKNRLTLDNRRENLDNMTNTEHEELHKMLRIAKTHGTC